MKFGVCFSLLAALMLTSTPWCRAQQWPAPCGNPATKFGVKTEKRDGAPAPPAQGKAQIVFLENQNVPLEPLGFPGRLATVRFGVDGEWVGADRGSSYFAVDVSPGVHHLCANWQQVGSDVKKDIDLTSFTAVPDKTYYFSAHVRYVSLDAPYEFGMKQLNPDMGQYRISALKLAKSRVK